jgi:hypothetical protein
MRGGSRSLAIATGAGAGIAIMLLAGSALASTDEVAPEKPRKVRGKKAIITFTQVGVPYSKHLKRIQVSEPIEVLVAKASKAMGRKISEVAFILATLIASEAESQPDQGKIAIAHAALTQADKLGVTLRTLLAPKRLGGKLGGQLGGYASTARPPTKHDVELAEGVISGKYPNPTPGAVQWDSPIAQDKLLKKGTPGYDMDASALARRRENEGKVPVYVAEVPRFELRLWRPAA